MLQVIKKHQLEAFRSSLLGLFQNAAWKDEERYLSTPGGALPKTEIRWNEEVGLWAYFHPEPFDGRGRWGSWFGSQIGEATDKLGPSIEINLALDPQDRVVAGRALIDEDGRYYLAHKGILGGGRGGQMSMAEFGARIRGFVREPVLHEDGREEMVIVIGALDDAGLLGRLRAFVEECERLRELARDRAGEELDEDDSRMPGTFSGENGDIGTGTGGGSDPITIDRLHGRVVNALHAQLKRHKIVTTNATALCMRPDLYLPRKGGGMDILFEVKASSDTQSWFTGIGQLVVYGSGFQPAPMRVLVVPTPRQDPAFAKALDQLSITVVTFTEKEGGEIFFEGLSSIIKAAQDCPSREPPCVIKISRS